MPLRSFRTLHRPLVQLAVIAVLFAAVAGKASAQNQDEEARVHFRLGDAYYASGRFEEAAREFEDAYRLSQRPQLLYNIFVARRDAGQLGLAIEALRGYLDQVPDAPDATQLRARLQSMERLHQQQQQSGETGTTGTTTGTTGTTGTEPTTEPGTTGTETTATTGAETTAEMPPPSSGGGGSSNVAPIIFVSAGAALLAGSLVTGLLAKSAESDLEDDCPMDRCDPSSDFEDTKDRGQTFATVSDVLLVTGIISAGVGVTLFIVGGSSGDEEEPSVSAGCTGDGCMGSVRLRF